MTLGQTATTLLDAFVAQLQALDVEIPERHYVAPGNLIPWDGEQLVVVLQQISQGQPGKPYVETYVPGAEILMAQFAVALLRVVPALSGEGFTGGMIPGAADLGGAGVAGVEDAQKLVTAAMNIHADRDITEAALQGFAVGPCTTLGPEDGLAGPRLLVEVNLG